MTSTAGNKFYLSWLNPVSANLCEWHSTKQSQLGRLALRCHKKCQPWHFLWQILLRCIRWKLIRWYSSP